MTNAPFFAPFPEIDTDMNSLLHTVQTGLNAEAFLTSCDGVSVSEIRKESADTRAWFVTTGGQAYFCKWVEAARYETLLAKDVAICSRQLHACIPRLLNKVEVADGVLLVFERVEGETLTTAEACTRFFALPLAEKLRALHHLFVALTAIVEAGWIMVDFYDGNVIYDFDAQAVHVFDFELFEPGEGFALELDRNYGSSRLMAPEEFVRGAWVDQRSNVYTLGRYAICALSTRIDAQWHSGFQGSDPLAEVLIHATQKEPSLRYPTVRAFLHAYEHALIVAHRQAT
jgi:serine/threonine-protein kinase